MTHPLLDVKDLRKSFGQRHAVDGVSFQVQHGQTLGLIGPNGAGKSTTVSMICALLTPDSGSASLNGQALSPDNQAAKRQIGLVPQDLALYDDLSARDNLRIFGALYGLRGAALAQRCQQVLELVLLHDRAADKPRSYSGGMKRRLNIAAAMMHEPKLLILDEPTVGVDPQSRNAIFDSLEQIKRQGCALIYTSHYMEEVERLADNIVIIDHGRVIADATPAALYQRLPAHAALQVTLEQPPGDRLLAALQTQNGVAKVSAQALSLHIELQQMEQAQPVLVWLSSQGCQMREFSTARTSLESVFLTLTGRSLRDA